MIINTKRKYKLNITQIWKSKADQRQQGRKKEERTRADQNGSGWTQRQQGPNGSVISSDRGKNRRAEPKRKRKNQTGKPEQECCFILWDCPQSCTGATFRSSERMNPGRSSEQNRTKVLFIPGAAEPQERTERERMNRTRVLFVVHCIYNLPFKVLKSKIYTPYPIIKTRSNPLFYAPFYTPFYTPLRPK